MSDSIAWLRFRELLQMARHLRASDLHVAAAQTPMIRVDGKLEVCAQTVIAPHELESLIVACLDEEYRARLQRHGDADVVMRSQDLGTLRIHSSRTRHGYALAVRLLPLEVPDIRALGVPRIAVELAQAPRGLLLIAGPTGSGKTSTFAALLEHINKTQARRILTVEDPIEFEHHSERSCVSQREIGTDVPSYEAAVLAALRADPDVIAIGEMRDAATMHAGLIAAETGHLIISTIHTGDAAQTIDRIVDAFPQDRRGEVRTQLAAALVGVVAQRLVPCAVGSGRRLLAEVLVATDAVRAMIRDGKTHLLPNVIATGRRVGMQSFALHGEELAQAGEIRMDARGAVGA
ncbi:MAG: type IV pilus twitching motility protein PilT [Vulcanimicrobiaceae bacterium]